MMMHMIAYYMSLILLMMTWLLDLIKTIINAAATLHPEKQTHLYICMFYMCMYTYVYVVYLYM